MRTLGLAIAAIVLIGGGTSAVASPMVFVGASVGPNGTPQHSSATGPITFSATDTGGSASALADYGVMKASATASIPIGGLAAGSNAGWQDDLFLNLAGGGTGFATATFSVSGSQSATSESNGYSQASFYFETFNYTTQISTQYSVLEQQSALIGQTIFTNGVAGGHLFGVQTFVIPFTSGDHIQVIANIGCGVGAIFGTSSCDLAHSAYWTGITSATAGFSVSATSGTNYQTSFAPGSPTPEPDTWAMMILGLGAAGSVLRRLGTARIA